MYDAELPKILIETNGRTRIIRFNRPKERSPLSIDVLQILHSVVDDLEKDKSIDRVVFTGADDVFASGADLREIAAVTAESAQGYAIRGQLLMNKISNLPQKTTAYVNGFCFGGGLDLALSCDERVATANAIFCHPGANLGIITGWGGTQRLPRLIGEAKALEMLLTAKRINAEEALQIGLIDEISHEWV